MVSKNFSIYPEAGNIPIVVSITNPAWIDYNTEQGRGDRGVT
jgi:hypothetical protein